MTSSRQLHLGAFMRPVSIHTGAWRYPGALPDANFNFAHLKRFAQTLERAKFDAFFMADHLAVLNMPIDALKRSHTVTSFEPFTLLSALAAVTERIGLSRPASTTYDEPYHIARRFASLDHISGGRAGWNIVTTSNPDAALNFGLDEHIDHDERYRRAREFYDVVDRAVGQLGRRRLRPRCREWRSSSIPAKMHVLDHKGEYLSVRGPLNIARPVQGWPVIVQAGASEAGRQLAAETAEVVFAAQQRSGRRPGVLRRREGPHGKLGRDPRAHEDPAGALRRGRRHGRGGEGQARAARQPRPLRQRHRLPVDRARPRRLGFDPDGPLPEIPQTNASKSGRERAIVSPRRENLTVRQLAQRARQLFRPGLRRHAAQRSPTRWRSWLASEGSDGFNVMFPYLPGGLDDFVGRVMPELQRRGLFRREYEGVTLREHLGLPRPSNRFFQN